MTSGPGNLQMVKKVVVTEGNFKDYSDEIQHEHGFTPYRLHKNADGTFVTHILWWEGICWAMLPRWRLVIEILHEINSKLIYFVKCDGSSDVALQGSGVSSRARGLKGGSGDKGSVGSRGSTGKRNVEGHEGPPGKSCKMGLLEAELELEHVVKKVTRETLAVFVNLLVLPVNLHYG